jgi:hypothetical protein
VDGKEYMITQSFFEKYGVIEIYSEDTSEAWHGYMEAD